jgi:hypothetical protein
MSWPVCNFGVRLVKQPRFLKKWQHFPTDKIEHLRTRAPEKIQILAVMEIDQGNGAPKLSPEADRELTRLWRTWRTVLEMLVDRVRPFDHL